METIRSRHCLGLRNSLVRVGRMAPQQAMCLHCHEFTELVLITGGSGIHDTGRLEYPIAARDVFVIKEGQVHGYKDTRNLQLTNIMFRREHLFLDRTDVNALAGYHALFHVEPEGLGSDGDHAHLRIAPEPWRKLIKKVSALQEELMCEAGGAQTYARTLLTQIVIEASRAYPGEREPGALRLAEVFTYIEENFRRRISTPELAEIAHLSLSTLQRRFRDLTGETLTAYINRRRIEHAGDLLRETDRSITEIAFQTGFEDSNYFAKVFGTLKGVSPRAFRKSQ